MAEEKLSYEELEQTARQLARQVEIMRSQLQKEDFNEAIARLNFSFQVLQNEKFFTKDYVNSIARAIQETLVVGSNDEEKLSDVKSTDDSVKRKVKTNKVEK